MMDLNLPVDLPHGVGPDYAIAINNNGQVITASAVSEAETYALMLAGLALVGFVARRRKEESLVKRD